MIEYSSSLNFNNYLVKIFRLKEEIMYQGQIRVGRCTYSGGSRSDPEYEGFKNILVLTASSPYASLSPYCLKDSQGMLMENLWQFAKVYETVPQTTCYYSRYDKRVIWKWPSETHAILKPDGSYDLTPEYVRWRHAGMNNPYAVRYPVGFNHRGKCLFALKDDENGNIIPKRLNYIEGRKEIYIPLYAGLARVQPQYAQLKERLDRGEKLNIVEVDGPHQESLNYYKEKYGVGDDFIVNNTMLATPENLDIMLNDSTHNFGHGYVLAGSLMGIY